MPAQDQKSEFSSDAAARVDRDLVASAYRKLTNKEEISKEERRALKRHEWAKEEKLRWQYYRSIPQKHWRAMSGRQSKVLNEQAARYGIPFGGDSVNLPDVAKALHDFLAENAAKLSRDDDPMMQGSGSPALERYREERAALARLDRLERERQLVIKCERSSGESRRSSVVPAIRCSGSSARQRSRL